MGTPTYRLGDLSIPGEGSPHSRPRWEKHRDGRLMSVDVVRRVPPLVDRRRGE